MPFRSARWSIALTLALGALSSTRAAHAAGECDGPLSTCVDADNLWMNAGAGPWLALGSTDTVAPGQASFGLVTSYLSRPVVLRVASADPSGSEVYAIDNAFDASFMLAMGVFEGLQLDAVVPATLYQSGGGIGEVTGSEEELQRSTLRHMRFGLTHAILPHPRAGSRDGLGILGRLQLAFPAGDPTTFSRASGLTFVPSVSADYIFQKLRVGLDLSARIRSESELAGARVGSQLGAALGVSYEVLPNEMLRVGAESFLLYTLADQAPSLLDREATNRGSAHVPAEWLLTTSTAPFFGGDLGFIAGGGSAIPIGSTAAVTTPRFRFDLGFRYAPLGLDADADTVIDRNDLCPGKIEDRDGFQDEDGCPDPDNDGDGILDEVDRCRDAAETVDGFQDEDGCPDLDDDNDGIADEDDRCRNEAEDKDGFQDEDGCPDPDNDGDGVLDAVDQCPMGAEDQDGFKDEDGCPDLDNDLDQIPDGADACRNEAEDKDGFQDEDGCPEPDNDFDGVLDRNDRCPNEAETIDGKDDADGCPEANARSLVSFAGDRVVSDKLPAFARGKADISKDLDAALRRMAMLLRGSLPFDAIIIEGHADRAGDESIAAQELAARRAEAVRQVFISEGLPGDRITAAAADPTAKRPPGSPAIDVTAVKAKAKK